MPNLYFISGLGADERAFSLIEKFEGFNSVLLNWIPHHKNESLNSYSTRLFKGQKPSSNDIVIGLSFGGLIAQEFAISNPIKSIILISSFRDKKDLKPIMQFLLNLRLYNLIPSFKIKWVDKIALQFFSIKSKEGQEGLLDMMQKTDPKFTKWALKRIRKSNYNQSKKTTKYNLLGTKDKLLRLWELENNNYFIENAGHLMVYENANRINGILKNLVETS